MPTHWDVNCLSLWLFVNSWNYIGPPEASILIWFFDDRNTQGQRAALQREEEEIRMYVCVNVLKFLAFNWGMEWYSYNTILFNLSSLLLHISFNTSITHILFRDLSKIHTHTHSDGYIGANSRFSILPKDNLTHGLEEPVDLLYHLSHSDPQNFHACFPLLWIHDCS